MKKSHSAVFRSRSLTTALVCLLALATTARAEDFLRYRVRPIGNKVRIDGSSNVHDWAMDGALIAGWFEVPAGTVLDSSQATVTGLSDGKLNGRAEIAIPVNSMQSGTQGMDQVMQDTMDAKDYPRIQYKLTEMKLKQPHAAGTPLQFDTKGELSLNGVTNVIAMPVSIESMDKSRLKIIGSVPLKMTDFKVKPPVKLGIFVTVPEVKISFECVVGASAKPAEAK